MTTRTDIHRKGAIIPAHYSYVFSYNLNTTDGGWPVPSYGVNCDLDGRTEHKGPDGKTVFVNGKHSEDGDCCIVAMVARRAFSPHGGTGKCTACGAAFIYGDVWRHDATGEHIHLGQDCAFKYGMMADRSEHELVVERLKATAASMRRREDNRVRREAFLAKHAGLKEALEFDHDITRDLARNFANYDLSDKQVALAFKLAGEVRAAKVEEIHVPAPVAGGRQMIEGTVVSVKLYEGSFGDTLKMTVKVTTPGGTWLCWGTVPGSISPNRGDVVRFKATLAAGREAHFALFTRPANAVIVTTEPAAAAI